MFKLLCVILIWPLCVTQYPEVVRSPGRSAVKCNQLSMADPKLADLMIFQLPLKRGITSLLSILDGCYSIQSVSYKLSNKKIPQHNLLLLHIFLHKCTVLIIKELRYLKAGNREISSEWFRLVP